MSIATDTRKQTIKYLVLYVFAVVFSNGIYADEMSLDTFLSQALSESSLLKVSKSRLEQAKLQKDAVQSRLGWSANGRTGVTHDVSALGSPSDRLDLTGVLERKLKSGDSFGLSGSYSYENVEVNLIQSMPDPLHALNFDVFYRMPMLKGSQNAEILQGLSVAESEVALAQAQLRLQSYSFARQAIDIYYNTAQLLLQIRSSDEQLDRVRKLKDFTSRNFKLGIAEKRDLLQIEAQEEAAIASRRDLELSWRTMLVELNRLLGRAADESLLIKTIEQVQDVALPDLTIVTNETIETHPERHVRSEQLKMAESQLEIQRDINQDTIDVLFSLGTRTRVGDLTNGKLNKTDYAAKINLEYRLALDKRGSDSQISRVLYEKNIAQEQLRDTENRLSYEVSSAYHAVTEVKRSVKHYQSRVEKEQQKYKEGMRDYQAGRISANIITQYENDLQNSDVALKLKQNDLERNIARLDLF